MSEPTNIDLRGVEELEILGDGPCQPDETVYDTEGNQYRVIEDLGSAQLVGWRRIKGCLVRYADK